MMQINKRVHPKIWGKHFSFSFLNEDYFIAVRFYAQTRSDARSQAEPGNELLHEFALA
jgi:hypothetical protein